MESWKLGIQDFDRDLAGRMKIITRFECCSFSDAVERNIIRSFLGLRVRYRNGRPQYFDAHKQWRRRNSDRVNENKRLVYSKNPERYRAQQRASYKGKSDGQRLRARLRYQERSSGERDRINERRRLGRLLAKGGAGVKIGIEMNRHVAPGQEIINR